MLLRWNQPIILQILHWKSYRRILTIRAATLLKHVVQQGQSRRSIRWNAASLQRGRRGEVLRRSQQIARSRSIIFPRFQFPRRRRGRLLRLCQNVRANWPIRLFLQGWAQAMGRKHWLRRRDPRGPLQQGIQGRMLDRYRVWRCILRKNEMCSKWRHDHEVQQCGLPGRASGRLRPLELLLRRHSQNQI